MEVMGNKSTSLSQGPDTGPTHREDGALLDNTTGSVSRDGPLGLSPELLASLQSLGENSDYTLLPHSLHQIAEAYSLQEDYQWAIQFLQLEKLYHERLLSNLAALQENWESRWREKNPDNSEVPEVPAETDTVSENYIQALIQICQTHPRPTISVEKMKNQTLQCCHNEETSHRDVEPEQKMNSGSETSSLQTGGQEGDEEEVGEEEKEVFEEGQEVEEEDEEEGTCAETPEEEEEVKVEWPSGVPQASDKELAKLSNTEGISSPDGLVSILKRRRASLDGLPPPSTSDIKPNSTRKVRFSEPDDGIEQDEVGGDSCLILLLLCLVTVVISIGGTALYCTLVDTYSNICTDFTQNVNFYAVNVQRFFEGLGHWLPLRT
ncbi:consortin, connexin sorting protein b [Solea solea]|uniref:consortin, connexin sorting protein b n=1 Tax=Solea solea TaxID=90069 RepID=UPI00272AE256|nr:consortin, connexin sorting protein b [Solea solea]XP_058470276.1 consortin, connexin sorting protein b [Solea solea]